MASNKCTVRDHLDSVALENIQAFNTAGEKKKLVNFACLNFFSLQRVVRHCETVFVGANKYVFQQQYNLGSNAGKCTA